MTLDPYELKKAYYSDKYPRKADYNPANEGKYFIFEEYPPTCTTLNSNFSICEVHQDRNRCLSQGMIPLTWDEYYSLLKEYTFFVFDFTDDMFVFEYLDSGFKPAPGTLKFDEEALDALKLTTGIGEIGLNFLTYRQMEGELDKNRLLKARKDTVLQKKLDMREEEMLLHKKRLEIIQKRAEIAEAERNLKRYAKSVVTKNTPPEIQELIKEDKFLLKWHSLRTLRIRKRKYTNLMIGL